MSRRPTNTSAGVSLFPFLAVLVCTMGALILLLIVTTKRIRAAAIEKARQSVTPEEAPVSEPTPILLVAAPEPEPQVDPTLEWQTQIEQLTAERNALRGQLTQLKSRADAAQAAMMRTKVKVASAADRISEVLEQQEQTKAERVRLQAEIASLQSGLSDAEQRLSKAIERQKSATSKFAFMPFDGRTGTTKRPVLIECTQDYIRFLPEDVRLTPADLNGFTSGFNPLLIASRELIHYWKAYDQVYETGNSPAKDIDSFENDLAALNKKEREPYVLLLVRPNGAVAFHIAKGLLAQLKVPHGYELISDDMEIDSSNPDPEAKQICQTAVDQVLSEREKVLQTLIRNRDLQRDQLQLEPTARTFVPKETSEPTNAFERPRSTLRPSVGSSERSSAPASTGRSAESPATNMSRGTSQTGAPPQSARPSTSPTGRLPSDDVPAEEPLPAARRYENDDTKPFPLARGERRPTAPTPSTERAPQTGHPNGSAGASTKTNNDPRAANNSSNGNNLAKMKRRYLMPRAGIGLEKAITIRIHSNRVVIGGEYEIPVDASVRTESLIDRVLIAMDRVQTDWPNPSDGYHWVPTIRYEVVPGGEQVHQRLNSGLFDLGLVSSAEFLESDPEAAKPSRESSRTRATPGGVR